jgi:hypothetical protein
VPLLQACLCNTTQKFSDWRYPRNEGAVTNGCTPRGLRSSVGAPFDLKRLSIVPPFAMGAIILSTLLIACCTYCVSCDLETHVGPSTALFPGGLSDVQATFLSAEC